MSCHDCLIWIGQTYKKVELFLREAERRGCCREVPSWPGWVIPEQTRIFLAHRDGTTRHDQGSIFGYFQPYRVAVTLTEADQASCKGHDASSDNGRSAALELLSDSFKGSRLPPVAVSDQVYTLSTKQTLLEEGRLCAPERGGGDRSGTGGGVRSEAQSIYFVDELAATIDIEFQTALKDIPEEEWARLLAVAREEREKGIQRGIPQFQEAIAAAQCLLEDDDDVPPELADHAVRRGCMVALDRPYPIYRRMPGASFRGILRIDGDEMIRRIAATYEPPEAGAASRLDRLVNIPNCDLLKPGQTGKRNQAQLVAVLSQDLKVNPIMTRRFLEALEGRIEQDLVERGSLILPRVGTFFIREKNGRKLVKFRPSTVLKRNVNKADTAEKE